MCKLLVVHNIHKCIVSKDEIVNGYVYHISLVCCDDKVLFSMV